MADCKTDALVYTGSPILQNKDPSSGPPSGRPPGGHFGTILELFWINFVSFLELFWIDFGINFEPLGFLLLTSYLLLHPSYFLLLTPYFLLPTSYFLLLTSYFVLLTSALALAVLAALLAAPLAVSLLIPLSARASCCSRSYCANYFRFIVKLF